MWIFVYIGFKPWSPTWYNVTSLPNANPWIDHRFTEWTFHCEKETEIVAYNGLFIAYSWFPKEIGWWTVLPIVERIGVYLHPYIGHILRSVTWYSLVGYQIYSKSGLFFFTMESMSCYPNSQSCDIQILLTRCTFRRSINFWKNMASITLSGVAWILLGSHTSKVLIVQFLSISTQIYLWAISNAWIQNYENYMLGLNKWFRNRIAW